MQRISLVLVLAVCLVPATRAADDTAPTYHRDVTPILQQHCQDCHRPGQVAPFPLLTYEHARKRAADLAAVTHARLMPPWPASTDEGGPFRDERRLSESELDTLQRWADAGAPEGDPASAPPARTFAGDWPLGPPDLIIKPSEEYELAATGPDELRVFVVPTGLTEGRWIHAIDYKPGNPRVVHHILGAFDTRGNARKLDERDPKPGYASFAGFGMIPTGSLDGWAPGKAPHRLLDGVGRYLPAGSDILIQIHYHKSGKLERDATAIGLYFADKPIQKQVRALMVTPDLPRRFGIRPDLRIPAGAENYQVRGSRTIRANSHAVAVIPHMHWLGKDFLLTATYPDGTQRTLIRINRWDFDWQVTYDFAEPFPLPAGTRLDMIAHFDNSEANPDNPSHPPKEVRWGEQTTDEMCIGFLQYTLDSEHLDNQPPPAFRDRPFLSGR